MLNESTKLRSSVFGRGLHFIWFGQPDCEIRPRGQLCDCLLANTDCLRSVLGVDEVQNRYYPSKPKRGGLPRYRAFFLPLTLPFGTKVFMRLGQEFLRC